MFKVHIKQDFSFVINLKAKIEYSFILWRNVFHHVISKGK